MRPRGQPARAMRANQTLAIRNAPWHSTLDRSLAAAKCLSLLSYRYRLDQAVALRGEVQSRSRVTHLLREYHRCCRVLKDCRCRSSCRRRCRLEKALRQSGRDHRSRPHTWKAYSRRHPLPASRAGKHCTLRRGASRAIRPGNNSRWTATLIAHIRSARTFSCSQLLRSRFRLARDCVSGAKPEKATPS